MTNADTSLPLFLKTPMLLDAKRHANAAIKGEANYTFSKGSNSVPLNATEFSMASKCYPIVFTDEAEPTPVVILGFEKESYFVNEKGEWKEGSYIPAYVRKYPFAFAEFSDAKQLALCVDEDAVQFIANGKGKNTSKLYDGEKPTAFTSHVLEFCTAFHNHFLITKQFGLAMKEAGLLSPHQSDVVLNNGRKMHLGGFQIIDQEAFNNLPDAKFLELRKQGWLPLVYFALQSSTNWKPLLDLASSFEKPARKKA